MIHETGAWPVDLEIVVSEQDTCVYAKFSGFPDLEDAESYAHYLIKYLPLLLHESETIH